MGSAFGEAMKGWSNDCPFFMCVTYSLHNYPNTSRIFMIH